MNIIFIILITCSTIFLTFTNPEGILSSMLNGGEKALNLTLKMVVIYAVWMGMTELLEQTGLANKISKLLKPINKFLFGTLPESAEGFISTNISANILGMSGATTPMGIKAVKELEKYPNTNYAITMFFVINATSIQVIPSSVLALRNTFLSQSPSDIILPTILATSISTIVGVLLVKIFVKRWKMFAYFIPIFFIIIFIFCFIKKVKPYEAFTLGAKQAIPFATSVFPYLVSIFVLTELFEVSGLSNMFTTILSPFFTILGIPTELTKLVLIKPFSGSGALALLSEIFTKYGVDSYISRCACVIYGSSETVFYVAAVYFAGAKTKKLTAPILISLFASFCSCVFACFICLVI